MSELDLEKLKQYRNEILKAEIGALLFNLGKTHIGFWKEKNGKTYFNVDDDSFKNIFGFNLFTGYKNYYGKDDNLGKSPFEYELEKYNLRGFIFNKKVKFPFKVKIKDNQESEEVDWIEFFKGDVSEADFIKKVFVRGCENINSGIDKGSPNKQLEPPLWLSNAFGGFKEKIEEKNFDKRRLCFLENFYGLLNEQGYLNGNPEWANIRNFVLNEIKKWYSHILSDSRFPINDVTLFDQAYMTASMFKAVLAQLVMSSSKLDEYQTNPSSIKWRILGIQYDKMGLIEKSLKLPSIRWYKETIHKIDEKIKELLEVKYPIGNEIYRDETGIYFIVGEELGEDLNDGSDLAILKNDLKEIKDKIVEIFENKLEGEVYPTIILTKASRGLMNLSTLLEKAKENFLKAKKVENLTLDCEEIEYNGKIYKVKRGKNFITIKRKDIDGNETEKKILNSAIGICPLCQSRLIYIEDKEKRNKPAICETCDKRIHHYQTSNWVKNLHGETIWTSEIKDKNNRIAYISLKFELMDWLGGDLVNSLLVRKEDYRVYRQIINNLFSNVKTSIWDLNLNFFSMNQDNLKNFFMLFDKNGIQTPFENLIKDKNLRKVLTQPQNNLNDREISLKDLFYRSLNYSLKFFNKSLNDFVDLINSIQNSNFDYNEKRFKNQNTFNDNNIREIIKSLFSLGFFLMQVSNILLERSIGQKWEGFIKSKLFNPSAINFENRSIDWNLLNDQDVEFLAELVLQFLLRKNPSPARLRRIWESTKEFLEKIHKKLDKNLEIPEWRRKRLVWEVDYINDIKETGEELEGGGLLFWAQPNEDKSKINIYLISSIEDFLEKFGKEELKEELNKEKEEDINLNKVKRILEKMNFTLELRKYSEDKDRGEGGILITLSNDSLAEIHSYKPYSLITDISPINYQVIVPAEYVPKFIDIVLEEYDKEFKYVYGKLPIHIGIVVSHYKKPVYVNLKALRKIRRDVKDTEKLWVNKDIERFKKIVKSELLNLIKRKDKSLFESLKNKSLEEIWEELKTHSSIKDLYYEAINNTKEYYALYFNNPDEKDYNFYIKPDNKWKVWLSTIDKFPLNSKVKMIPNTFDFEFMDSNIRREDIYYDEEDNYKRAIKIKANRPYELETYWDKFKSFRELFKEQANRAKMHKLINIFYDKLQNYDKQYNPLLASAIVNILELKKHPEFTKHIKNIFDLNCEDNVKAIHEALINSLDEARIRLFIDMFEFWHTALKEV